MPLDQDTPFRIPDYMTASYRRWAPPGYGGWLDAALHEGMTQRQRTDPLSMLSQQGAQVARSRRNLTVKVEVGGRPVWIKRFRASGPIDRLLYAVRAGKAVYAWNAAMALLEQGFCTPRPLFGLRAAGRLRGADGIIGFEDLAGHRSLRELLQDAEATPQRRDRLVRSLGEVLRRFHDRGFRHRDLRQGNILAAELDGGWRFCLLDLNRLRVQPPLSTIQRLREVEKLNLPEDVLAAFFSAYMPERDSSETAAACRNRILYADRLERLPMGRLLRKAWYYSWELRAFSRARRP
ncbi:MAG TPA: lipopolysaccharide kinase InaA family protein [Arenicellales bacterium]|nr:lipopolysaccharide kinase InaA family protein [Arenicellales bacterium]